MSVLDTLRDRVLLFDGAMGTLLQSMGLPAGTPPDAWCLANPDAVKEAHRLYAEAGAEVVETNTFGATPVRLSRSGLEAKAREISIAGVHIAREAVNGKALVAGCIGPLGVLVEPMGDFGFDAAYEQFSVQAKAFAQAEPDLLIIDTIYDLNEMRAAILACKDHASAIPLIAHLTLGSGSRALTGTGPETAGIVTQSLGADAVGFNCSVGPDLLVEPVSRLAKVARVPISVQPNAGMPYLADDGLTRFAMGPEEFASYGPGLLKAGARIIGGCCGTTPAHIRMLRDAIRGISPIDTCGAAGFLGREVSLASRTMFVFPREEDLPILIGERINPTGRKVLSKDIKEGRFQILRDEAKRQEALGVQVLDVNVGVPLIDEAAAMSKAVAVAQDASALPVCVDSASVEAIGAGLKACVGKALVNSFSLEQDKADSILRLAKRYGAAVVGLTIDEKGMPDTAEKRLEIAGRLVEKALSHGIPRWDVVIDPLALTAGAQQSQAMETLKAIRLIKEELGVRTSLGVSNVSFGLPNRSFLNAAFLTMAIAAGLDFAIVNPLDERVMDAVRAARVLTNKDVGSRNYIAVVGPKKLVHAAGSAGAIGSIGSVGPTGSTGSIGATGIAVSTDSTGAVSSSGSGNLPDAAGATGLRSATDTANATGSVSQVSSRPGVATGVSVNPQVTLGQEIHRAVLEGDKTLTLSLVEKALAAEIEPLRLLNEHLIPAINEVGRLFAEGVYFLPQLMLSASAMKAAFGVLRPLVASQKLKDGDAPNERGVVVMATVRGDVHDIGKNIVAVLLESHGFRVIDLGCDVEPEKILLEAKNYGADMVCLSALMTTTMPQMKKVVDLFLEKGFECPVLVGGAATSRSFASQIGAWGYGKDAHEAVSLANSIMARRDASETGAGGMS